MKLLLIFVSLSFCFPAMSLAQNRTLLFDNPFKVVSPNDSVASDNCTLQTAEILDSLKSIFSYSFVENNSENYSTVNFKMRGIIFETDSIDGHINFLRKSYCVKLELLDAVRNDVVGTRTIALNSYDTFLIQPVVRASLLNIILDLLKDMP